MNAYKGFEDTRVWQTARDLIRRIFAEVESAPVSRERVLKEGLKSEAVRISVMISQGCEARDPERKAARLRDAQGAAAAVRAQIVHCEDLKLLSADFAAEVREGTLSIAAQLGAWLRSMRERRGGSAGRPAGPRRTQQPTGNQEGGP